MKNFFRAGSALLPVVLLTILAGRAPAAFIVLKEKPTFPDVAYGPDPKQKMDIFVPTTGPGPFPILFYIHGGGWFAGDKVGSTEEPAPYLKQGCAVVSINYRLTGDALAEHITPPITAVLGDNRRALQYVRLHAADWNLDPARIVVTGGSAGGASSLYLACEGEQANPNAADPVERVSTKILGAGCAAAQTTIDPQRSHEWVPGCAWAQWCFEPVRTLFSDPGLPDFNKFLADRAEWLPYFQKYSADFLLTKDAAPIYFIYAQTVPAPGSHPSSQELVHCPLWGIGFQKLAQERGAECYLQYPGHPPEKYGSMGGFILHQLGLDHKK